MKLFVGNIPYSMTEDELREIFEECGSLASCKLIIDRETGRSKGFGFIEYKSEKDALAAIEKYHNAEVKGKELVVNEARPQENKNRRHPANKRY
jgi:cold-inducible RNA-binding protein